MHIQLAPSTLEALAQIISGGSGNDNAPPIGVYRSGPKLESFMRGCNVSMSVGNGSRLPALIAALERTNSLGDQDTLKMIIERAADPRDFLDQPEKLSAVIDYLNARLRYDGLELHRRGGQVRLGVVGKSPSVIDALSATITLIDFDTVSHDLERALSSAESDPEDAVTSACSVLESVCRSILVELELPLPEQKDIQGLYRAVREPLGLSPGKSGVPDNIANDVRSILGGLNSVIQGIGALRTHGGDAHGREKGHKRVIDSRIARLAIHSASAAALFLIETWQQKYPAVRLRAY
ncbi:abortive infection family protein [Ancylobacter terrae]|uniref:abortive infection family protein n=1 Tax=Ancylobacter sp. sgz301288 TaxID=3342077 RepID=UPI00385D34E3